MPSMSDLIKGGLSINPAQIYQNALQIKNLQEQRGLNAMQKQIYGNQINQQKYDQRNKMAVDSILKALAFSKDNDGEATRMMLDNALSQIDPNSSPMFYKGIESLKQLPDNQLFDGLIRVYDRMQQTGLAPKSNMSLQDAQSNISARIMEAETEKERTSVAKLQLDQRKLEFEAEKGKIPPTMQTILDKAQTAAFESEKTANEFNLLVKEGQRVYGGKTQLLEFFNI